MAATDPHTLQMFSMLIGRIFDELGRAIEATPNPVRPQNVNDILREARELITPWRIAPSVLLSLMTQLSSRFDERPVTPVQLANIVYGQRELIISQATSLAIQSDLVIKVESETLDDTHTRLIRLDEISDDLLQILLRDFQKIHQLSPRKYEALVTELLIREGFDARMTPTTRDGGFDILASKQGPEGSILLLAECKRWSPERPVNVAVVRALYGTVEMKKATAGLLVTTSRFTSVARTFEQQIQHRMALRDYDQLYSWLARVCQRGWRHNQPS